MWKLKSPSNFSPFAGRKHPSEFLHVSKYSYIFTSIKLFTTKVSAVKVGIINNSPAVFGCSEKAPRFLLRLWRRSRMLRKLVKAKPMDDEVTGKQFSYRTRGAAITYTQRFPFHNLLIIHTYRALALFRYVYIHICIRLFELKFVFLYRNVLRLLFLNYFGGKHLF